MIGVGFNIEEVREIAGQIGIDVLGDSLPSRVRGRDKGRDRCTFLLRPYPGTDTFRKIIEDPYVKSGRRRVGAICWHGHYRVMAEIFSRHPEARIESSLATYDGVAQFERNADYTGSTNIGSMAHPQSFRSACDCATNPTEREEAWTH